MTGVKKTHWLRNTLIVLLVCGLAGTALAAVLFYTEENRTYASSSILFSFKGADEGKAPNGYRFDISGLTSDEVLNAALEDSGLTGVYTAGQLRGNLSVAGVYPEKIAEQMTKYVSLLDAEADLQAAILDFHATQYNIALYREFDRNIDAGKLKELLGNIMTEFRAWFARTYASNLDSTDQITDLENYDYTQQLEVLGESVRQNRRYAEEMAAMAPGFSADRKGFGDIAVRFTSLENDIDGLNATVTLNVVSKNRELLREQYETEMREQQNRLAGLTEELKQIDELVRTYDKDGVIYISVDNELYEVGNDENGVYDRLVTSHKEVTDAIAETNAKIALYQTRLEDMNDAGAEESGTLKETVENRIAELTERKNAAVSDFSAMLDAYSAQEINDRTVSLSSVKYRMPSLFSGAFLVRVVKTAGPLCAVGFMVCMALLIASRRKEEKAKQ